MPVFSWVWRLAADPEKLWPLLSDTDRFNREAGLPPVRPVSDGDEAGPERKLEMRVLGRRIVFHEEPFEWVRPRRLSVRRRFASGPLREMRVAVVFDRLREGGTRLGYRVDMRPRNALWAPLVRAAGFLIGRRFGGAVLRLDRAAQGEPVPESRHPGKRFEPGGKARLHTRYGNLLDTGADPLPAARLRDLLLEGDDRAVARLRPYALAAEWGADRRATLELCLWAVRCGLLDFRWDLLCPSCRGTKSSSSGLRGMKSPVHCDACRIDFRAVLDRSVEVTFRPNASLRVPESAEFCVGGPQRTPHVALKLFLDPGTSAAHDVALEAGQYRLRSPAWPGALPVRVSAGGDEVPRAEAGAQGWPRGEAHWGPRPRLTLSNPSDKRVQLLLERTAWADDAATAAEVTALQAFRDLFAEEALRPGEEISVGSLAFLFTDLRGSTRLYREVGDARAFALVMEHFDLLKDAIAKEGGGVVKTIGDAVMAVFPRPAAALRAAAEAHRRMAESMQPLVLKAGVHCGTCIAVNQNDRLDYFGSTLNLSARLLGFCAGGDIVLTQEVADDPEAAEWMKGLAGSTQVESLEAAIRGFDRESFVLRRIIAPAPQSLNAGPPKG